MKKFIASNFKGECIIDESFEIYLLKMNDIAKQYNMTVIVTSSFRKDTNVKGAIVIPATKSNHLVGHAVDINLQNRITGEYYNSAKMRDNVGADELFCDAVVVHAGLRWGQAFNVPDSVHFDDALNLRNTKLWEEKYRLIHGGPVTDNTVVQKSHL